MNHKYLNHTAAQNDRTLASRTVCRKRHPAKADHLTLADIGGKAR